MLKNTEIIKQYKMNKEEILESLVPMETETKLKAWTFQADSKFYQVVSYGGVYRVPPTSGIWECNKKGKRISEKPIFKIENKNHLLCLGQFLDTLIEKEIEKELEKDSTN
jgi:hypothetical protein